MGTTTEFALLFLKFEYVLQKKKNDILFIYSLKFNDI